MAKKQPSWKDFKVVGAKKSKSAPDVPTKSDGTPFWWLEPTDAVHESVFSAVRAIWDQQATRRESLLEYSRLYRPPVTLIDSSSRDRVRLNVCRMAVDTLSSKIAKSKPKASVTTDGGNWSQQRRAKRLDKFGYGALLQMKAYAKGRRIFRDCCVKDIGVAKFYREGATILMARVRPEDLLVDEVDGLNGEPRCYYQRAAVHREVLKAHVQSWPLEKGFTEKERDALILAISEADAPTERPDDIDSTDMSEFVEVREAWHLPGVEAERGKDTDGRHVMCISTGTLTDEPYYRCRPPFSFMRFGEAEEGFYGVGVVESQVDWQRSINTKLRRINKALNLMASPQYWEQSIAPSQSTGIAAARPLDHITNEIGILIRSARKPELLNTGVVVPPQLFDSLQWDIRQALESVGVNELNVSAKKPTGIDSGVGLRELDDIGSERFILVGQMLEEFYVDATEQVFELAEEAAAAGEPITIQAEGRGGIKLLEWDQVKLDRKEFVVKAFPTSSLPSTPAARKQAVTEMQGAGWIDSLEARRLMDMPDLESSNNVALAARDDIEAEIERILEDGDEEELPEPRPPEPYQDLEYGLKRFQSAYLRARNSGVPEERLAMLREWMAQAEDLLASSQPPAPAAPVGPPAPDAGMPPPVV